VFIKSPHKNPARLQGQLLSLAAIFLGLFSLALTISPIARSQIGQVEIRWDHWVAFVLWVVTMVIAHYQSLRWIPDRDPYLLPVIGLLSGWGLLTIWRLDPSLGLRQSIWLLVASVLLILGFRLPYDLRFLRHYKYLWLTSILLLTGLTFLFGTNPLGYGPRMWLGCCGIYLQPSEPLKLLLVVYLAAYLADRNVHVTGSKPTTTIKSGLISPTLPRSQLNSKDGISAPSITSPLTTESVFNKTSRQVRNLSRLIPLLAPTLIMLGLATTLLIVQRDLGTAFILVLIYTFQVYLATGEKWLLVLAGIAFTVAIAVGYAFFDVVHLRVDAWLNPWLDPSGNSYQIVQSLIAIANGGIIGRGPGLGYPELVPIAHSDFIFTSITEEMGLIGVIAILMLIAIFINRGIHIAISTSDVFRRFLAAGLVVLLVGQSLWIISANLRLLPLTGITLPFVSYGGSSLVTSFLSVLFLLHISRKGEGESVIQINSQPYLNLAKIFYVTILIVALATGWWTIYRSPGLLGRTDNPRRSINDRFVLRGTILDRRNNLISSTIGNPGEYARHFSYPDLSNVIGYINPTFGQTGLETTLDTTLRGQKGNPSWMVWWHYLLYGHPPLGLDVRTSLDLDLQSKADELLREHKGALVLINAQNGEILAMASHPTFNANNLDTEWEQLMQDRNSPLLNRATQGLYPVGPAASPFLLAKAIQDGSLPNLSELSSAQSEIKFTDCANPTSDQTWGTGIANGCSNASTALGKTIGADQIQTLFQNLGFYTAPQLLLPTTSSQLPKDNPDETQAALGKDLRLSPLQMALAAATLSGEGVIPSPQLATAANLPDKGWMLLPASETPRRVFSQEAAQKAAKALAVSDQPFWQSIAIGKPFESNSDEAPVTWFLGGSLPGYPATPLALALLLEDTDTQTAIQIGQTLLQTALNP